MRMRERQFMYCHSWHEASCQHMSPVVLICQRMPFPFYMKTSLSCMGIGSRSPCDTQILRCQRLIRRAKHLHITCLIAWDYVKYWVQCKLIQIVFYRTLFREYGKNKSPYIFRCNFKKCFQPILSVVVVFEMKSSYGTWTGLELASSNSSVTHLTHRCGTHGYGEGLFSFRSLWSHLRRGHITSQPWPGSLLGTGTKPQIRHWCGTWEMVSEMRLLLWWGGLGRTFQEDEWGQRWKARSSRKSSRIHTAWHKAYGIRERVYTNIFFPLSVPK